MKKNLKNIHFGAVAVLLGLALIFTQSAFKPAYASTWGQDPTLGWVNINSLPSTGDPDTHYEYQCAGAVNTCLRIYSTGDPINGGSFSNSTTGNFSLEEVPN